MDFPVSRELHTIQSSWSTPQLLEALRSTISGEGPALTTNQIDITKVEPTIALVVTTSGSTGTPKYVALSADSLTHAARATNEFLGAEHGARWSLLLPTTHIAGLNVLFRSIVLGSVPVSVREDADFSAIVPTQLHRALNGDHELLEHLRKCRAVLVGGGPLDSNLQSEAMLNGVNVVTTYGMTETCGGVVYDGLPLPGVELRILEGAIAIKAPQLALGYLNAEFPIKDGYFITSDLGAIVDGHLLIHGRSDDQIISGGEKISLGEIERFLKAEFNTLEIVAFAKPDSEWGDRLCIASTIELEIDEISRRLRNRFGRHASAKEFIRVDSIPYLSLGKPDRKRLVNDNT